MGERGKAPLAEWRWALPQKAVELAAGRVEGSLFFLRRMMREQRSAVVINRGGNQFRDGPLSECWRFPEFVDEFATQPPKIVTVQAPRLGRQSGRQ